MNRRTFLKNSTIVTGVAAAQAALPLWMPRLAFAQPYNDPKGDVLISIFLRGGADSLNMIVPHTDENYYTARPQLAIARPDANVDSTEKVLDLDGTFGLHPSMSALHPIFAGGHMKAIHATGSPHDSRSHFEAMSYMERGEAGSYNLSTGWIARHLNSLLTDNPSPVRGVGWGVALPQQLAGAPSTIALQSIVDYHLDGDTRQAEAMMRSLQSLYSLDNDALTKTAEGTQAAIGVLQAVDYANYQPQRNAAYPETDFGRALQQTAALIRAQVGLEVACIDLGGWDTHANQGGATGTQANLMAQLADGLAAFHTDMQDEMHRISVVVMSEFGRRLEENASRGTDHGHGGAMLLMGGNFADTSPVYAEDFSLAPNALVQGDLAITTDYRAVIGELLHKRLKNDALTEIFPNYMGQEIGLFTT